LNETDKTTSDARTPGRRARAASAWGRADLARRVARLPIPEESRGRVARFVEDEVERAVASSRQESVPLAGLDCPKCQKPIEADLRKKQREAELVAALEKTGLSMDELEKLVNDARGGKGRS
jgi:hypothetical protein